VERCKRSQPIVRRGARKCRGTAGLRRGRLEKRCEVSQPNAQRRAGPRPAAARLAVFAQAVEGLRDRQARVDAGEGRGSNPKANTAKRPRRDARDMRASPRDPRAPSRLGSSIGCLERRK
jgi:hypothetical protein